MLRGGGRRRLRRDARFAFLKQNLPLSFQADEEAATHADRATPGAPSAVVNATPAKKAKHNVTGVGKVRKENDKGKEARGLARATSNPLRVQRHFSRSLFLSLPLFTSSKTSGRRWKEPALRANTLRPAILSTSWAKKMAAKSERLEFQAAKATVAAERKDKARGIRAARDAAKARKEANAAAAAVVQKITKASTLQRLMKSKKQRKTLRKADTV